MAFQMPLLWQGISNATGMNPDWEISPPRVTINALSDEILLMIFDFCRVAVMKAPYLWSGPWTETWHNLVLVCQRWRYVVFSSPRSLDLRLYCRDGTSARKMLKVWPAFPIEIRSVYLGDNIIAALEHRRDHICNLSLYPPSYSKFERLATVMANSFPALTHVQLRPTGKGEFGHAPVLPNTFLGGSAPHLQSLSLHGIAFPTLPQFLLSSNDLSELLMYNIPDFGYISPEAMATGLSGLTRLRSLGIEFEKEENGTIRGRPRPPPLSHSLLPALTSMRFRGSNEYLEDLLARIDTPQIKILFIHFFRQSVIDIRQVVSRSPSLGPFDCAMLKFDRSAVLIHLHQSGGGIVSSRMALKIGQRGPGQQLSSLRQICTQSSSLLSSVTELNIKDDRSFSVSVDDEHLMSNHRWLVLFNTFTAARTLRLSGKIPGLVVFFLGGLTRERAIEVLPELQNLYVCELDWRDELEEPLEKFIAARQHSDHPVTWDMITRESY